jgi:hypothetical protein
VDVKFRPRNNKDHPVMLQINGERLAEQLFAVNANGRSTLKLPTLKRQKFLPSNRQ